MKFYYNGKLIRESKTNDYNFALLRYGVCISCSKSIKGVQKDYREQIKYNNLNAEDLKIVEITDKRA